MSYPGQKLKILCFGRPFPQGFDLFCCLKTSIGELAPTFNQFEGREHAFLACFSKIIHCRRKFFQVGLHSVSRELGKPIRSTYKTDCNFQKKIEDPSASWENYRSATGYNRLEKFLERFDILDWIEYAKVDQSNPRSRKKYSWTSPNWNFFDPSFRICFGRPFPQGFDLLCCLKTSIFGGNCR